MSSMTNLMTSRRAVSAYRAAIAHRSLRQQEADVFRQANSRLRDGRDGGGARLTRAVADNQRLWHAVMDTLRDPDNRLPDPIRAAILSIGHSVQREMRAPNPDTLFLIAVNEQIAEGLES